MGKSSRAPASFTLRVRAISAALGLRALSLRVKIDLELFLMNCRPGFDLRLYERRGVAGRAARFHSGENNHNNNSSQCVGIILIALAPLTGEEFLFHFRNNAGGNVYAAMVHESIVTA